METSLAVTVQVNIGLAVSSAQVAPEGSVPRGCHLAVLSLRPFVETVYILYSVV